MTSDVHTFKSIPDHRADIIAIVAQKINDVVNQMTKLRAELETKYPSVEYGRQPRTMDATASALCRLDEVYTRLFNWYEQLIV